MDNRLCNPTPEDDFRHQQMRAIRDWNVAEFERIVTRWRLTRDQETFFLDFIRHKLSHPGVRGYFVGALYCWVKQQMQTEGKRPKKNLEPVLSKLSLVAEWAMVIQYRENHLLDGKYGLLKNNGSDLDKAQAEKALLSSDYLKDRLYEYVEEEVFPNNPGAAQGLNRALRQMFRLVDEGQHNESQYGNYAAFSAEVKKIPVLSGEAALQINEADIDWFWNLIYEAGIPKEKELFTRQYLRRINLTSAALFVLWAQWMMDALGYQGCSTHSLLGFTARYGMLSQLVNDVCDFVPEVFQKETAAKHPEDAMSDLRNDVVTLPMLFFFQQFLNTTLKDLQMLYELSDIAVFDKMRPVIKKTALPLVQKMAEELKTLLPAGNPYAWHLNDMTNQAFNWRFFRYFSNKKYYKKIEALKQQSLSYII